MHLSKVLLSLVLLFSSFQISNGYSTNEEEL
jgi:hypothetical protein